MFYNNTATRICSVQIMFYKNTPIWLCSVKIIFHNETPTWLCSVQIMFYNDTPTWLCSVQIMFYNKTPIWMYSVLLSLSLKMFNPPFSVTLQCFRPMITSFPLFPCSTYSMFSLCTFPVSFLQSVPFPQDSVEVKACARV